ncbi:MAG: S1C family serine protease [Burkholderiales bacterium]
MRNLKARLACFVGSTIFLAAAGGADTPKSQAERARIEYVQKALKGEPSPVPGRRMIGSGTGFFVAPQRVLTAHHVIERCAALTIRGNDGKTVTAERVADEKKHDLALISIQALAASIATFRPTDTTRAGEAVATVGYPLQGLPRIEPFLTVGTRVGVDSPDGPSRFAMRADVRPGNSGGPVLDAYGQVVGLVTAKIDTVTVYKLTGQDIQKVGFAVATGPVLEFLRQSGIEPSPAEAPPVLGMGEELLGKARQFTVRVGCWQ